MFFGKQFWQFVLAVLLVQVLLFGAIGYAGYTYYVAPLVDKAVTLMSKINTAVDDLPFGIGKPKEPKRKTVFGGGK